MENFHESQSQIIRCTITKSKRLIEFPPIPSVNLFECKFEEKNAFLALHCWCCCCFFFVRLEKPVLFEISIYNINRHYWHAGRMLMCFRMWQYAFACKRICAKTLLTLIDAAVISICIPIWLHYSIKSIDLYSMRCAAMQCIRRVQHRVSGPFIISIVNVVVIDTYFAIHCFWFVVCVYLVP